MAQIDLRRLTHTYPGGTAPALDAVSMTLDPGLHVVAGESGSGKSTLLRVLNGLIPHFHGGRISGSCRVAGLDTLRTPTRELARVTGFVFQDPEAQFVGGTVLGEVAFGLENLGVAPPEMRSRVEAALALTGLTGLETRRLTTLSGGERQRVAVAGAIAMGQPVLALDEPTSQLDAVGTASLLAHCAGLAEQGRCVVLSEHRLDLLLARATTLTVVDGGRVAGPGNPHQLAATLAAPPQVVSLGLSAGWDPLPLLPAAVLPRLRFKLLPARTPSARDWAWGLTQVVAGVSGTPVLEVTDLCGGRGEVVVLVGLNGSGKSTLLRTIGGLIPVLAGRVERRPGLVAYLPQNPGAVLHRPTVAAEVAFTLRHHGRDEALVPAVLAESGLAGLGDRYPRDLSCGERQRAAIAAMLCGAPSLALLDEPTRGMDASARERLAAVVRRLAEGGCAVVVATHDSELAAAIADRVVEVGDGRVRDHGDPRGALSGASPYATPLGSLWPNGPLTVEEALTLR